MPVESVHNPTVRLLRALHDREGRKEHAAFLIEGKRLVAEAVAAQWPLSAALFDAERAKQDPELASLAVSIPGALAASVRAIKHAADTANPQGIVAAAKLPRENVAPEEDEPIVLVMDGIADPGNAGTLLRSALAASVRTVLSCGGVDLFGPKVVRGAMGAHFHLAIAAGLSWEAIASRLGGARRVAVAAPRAELVYHRFDWTRLSALIVGGEASGPSKEALRLADSEVSIPLDRRVESLNAAVAGSVILFEAKRQREIVAFG